MAEQVLSHRAHHQVLHSSTAVSAQDGKINLVLAHKVIKLAGKDIKNVYDYTDAMSAMKPDIEYEVIIKRGTETLTLKIIPAAARR